MNKKFVLLIFASAFLLLATLGAQFIMPVVADPAIINVPRDYPTIQAAINAASRGDTINVSSGIYYEHVVVNKSLSLIGEDRSTTIIDGNGTGTVIRVHSNDVSISSFTIRNGGRTYWDSGIYISFYNSCMISGNVITDNWAGILLNGVLNSMISGNVITDNLYWGIALLGSENNIIIDNTIKNNSKGVEIFFGGGNNTISGNTIALNYWYGIYIVYSGNNAIYHNSFVNNRNQTYSTSSINTWDNGAEGNYWSDYDGTDVDGDGIGDTILPHLGVDFYPLMAPWNEFRVFTVLWEEKVYQVTTFSHSTIASFNFSHLDKQISFNVTGPPGTSGFCNVTIPKALLGANETHPWQVLLDGNLISYTKVENETHTTLNFIYTHTTHLIQIIGTWVTPEFPAALILPILIATALLAIILGMMTQKTKKSHTYVNSKRSNRR